MKYWVSFSAFQLFELFADFTIGFILPFYIELKLISIVWLVLGTKLIFDSIVNRELTKREKSIDKWLNKIFKGRDELVAMIWYEISRCSIKIVTGGLSVLARAPELQGNNASPIGSDEDEAEQQLRLEGNDDDDDNDNDIGDQSTVHYLEQQDPNENTVSMEWAAITLKDHQGTNNNNSSGNLSKIRESVAKYRGTASSYQVASRKSARQREQLFQKSYNELD